MQTMYNYMADAYKNSLIKEKGVLQFRLHLQEPLAVYDEVQQEEPPMVFEEPPSDDGFL